MYPHTFRTPNTETVTTSSNYGSFYAKQKHPFVAIPDDIVPLFDFVDCNHNEFVANLREIIGIPNISARFENRHDMTKAINLIEKWFKILDIKYESFDVGWCEMCNVCFKMPNIILGKNINGWNRRKKTLLIYSHIDICIPDDHNWETDPFEVVEKNNCLHGKGVAYGKGMLTNWLNALYTYKKCGKELPVNIKFIIDSFHEKHNGGLEKFLHSRKDQFFRDVDYIVISETEWLGSKTPCLSYGAVGECKFELIVEKYQDSNPKEDLENICTLIFDNEDNILVPHINKHVVPVTPEEEQIYDLIDYDFESLRTSLPENKRNLDKVNFLMNFWRLPNICVGSVEECNCEKKDMTIYKRKFTIKIVPLQLPETIGDMVVKYVYEMCTKIGCRSKVECEMVASQRPWLEDFQTANYVAACRAILEVYRVPPNYIREDKTIPIVLLLQRLTDKNILLLPIVSANSNIKKPNENIHKKQFSEGIKVFIAYLDQLAKV